MFGHQDENPQSLTNSNPDAVASATTAPVYADPLQQLNNTAGPTPTITSDPQVDGGGAPDRQVLSPAGGYPQPTTKKIRQGGDEEEVPVEEPLPTPAIAADPTPPPPPQEPTVGDDLNSIKQQVITELFPLIDQLDQTPDERFKTLMMMIQATDNQTLLKSAYEAAHAIADSKEKAQALLDILNEINYFTHTGSNS